VSRISDLLVEKGIVAQMANNEGLAGARLNGARLADLRGVAIMKSVGMHVAADALAIGNLSEPQKPGGGAMVIVGDDPWNETTQINSDSRFLEPSPPYACDGAGDVPRIERLDQRTVLNSPARRTFMSPMW
jgi:indolepyruvate ferredoxin oxidoreductase